MEYQFKIIPTPHPASRSSSLTLPALVHQTGCHCEYRIANIVGRTNPFMAPEVDTLSPPCHPFNRWLSSGQNSGNLSQFHLCFHHPRVDSGSGSILIVSFSDFVAYNDLHWLVSTFSTHMKRPAIKVLHGSLISIVWSIPRESHWL